MSVVGQPLKGRHGVCLFSAQPTQGTAVTPATAVGFVDFDVTQDPDLKPVYSLGTAAPILFKPGITKTTFSVPIKAVQTSALMIKAMRASGVVPWVTLGFGYQDDAATKFAWQVVDCKINTLELHLDGGGILGATIGGTGGLITNLTTLVAANLAPTPMFSYEAVLTAGGSATECKGFRLNVNNAVAVDAVIPGVAPSTFVRGWSYQTEGKLEITGELTRFVKSGDNLQANTLTSRTIVLTLTDILGGMTPNTITVTLTGCVYGSEKFTGAAEGDVMFSTPFMATGITIA